MKKQIALFLFVVAALSGCSSAPQGASVSTTQTSTTTTSTVTDNGATQAPAKDKKGSDASSAISSVTVQTTSGPHHKGKAEPAHVPTEAELKLAAVHIKQVWLHQVPAESLNDFERKTYSDIYYRKLPKDRLRNWDKFLTQPPAPPGQGRMVPVTLPGMPTGDATH